jgi:hypothetical protein
MADFVQVADTAKFSVEVSPASFLVYAGLKQYNEVVFWERSEIPDIPADDNDVHFPLQVQQRVDSLAFSAYGDSDFLWALAQANGIRLPPLRMNPGFDFRIPSPSTIGGLIRGSA